jgi:hypothetical protein
MPPGHFRGGNAYPWYAASIQRPERRDRRFGDGPYTRRPRSVEWSIHRARTIGITIRVFKIKRRVRLARRSPRTDPARATTVQAP